MGIKSMTHLMARGTCSPCSASTPLPSPSSAEAVPGCIIPHCSSVYQYPFITIYVDPRLFILHSWRFCCNANTMVPIRLKTFWRNGYYTLGSSSHLFNSNLLWYDSRSINHVMESDQFLPPKKRHKSRLRFPEHVYVAESASSRPADWRDIRGLSFLKRYA